MGNLPSKEDTNEQSLKKNIRRPSQGSSESSSRFPSKVHFNCPSKRRSVKTLRETTVSPVRHQRVTADPTSLTPLSSISSKSSPRFVPAQLKRNPGSQESYVSSLSEEIKTPPPSRTVIFEEAAMQKEFDTKVIPYGAERERDRQTREHYILKQVFKGSYHVELNNPKKILDSACGVGLWSLEMGEKFPECQVIGVDILPPSEKYGWSLAKAASAGQTNNVVFQYEDICQTALSFSDNTFDFVFQRDVSTIVPCNQWPNLIREIYRITTPGGKVELVEYDMMFKNPGPVLSLINEWYRAAASAIQTQVDYTELIPEYLENAGFIHINQQEIYIPLGEWSSDPLQRQYGYLYKEQMKSLFKSMKEWWCKESKVTSQEYDRICEDALDEFEEYQSSAKWTIFTATKPESA